MTPAEKLWTDLLDALRADGLIAPIITQSGPRTTALILRMVKPWLSMRITPTPGCEVLAVDERGCMAAVHYDDVAKTWMWNGSSVVADRFVKWRYVELPR